MTQPPASPTFDDLPRGRADPLLYAVVLRPRQHQRVGDRRLSQVGRLGDGQAVVAGPPRADRGVPGHPLAPVAGGGVVTVPWKIPPSQPTHTVEAEAGPENSMA